MSLVHILNMTSETMISKLRFSNYFSSLPSNFLTDPETVTSSFAMVCHAESSGAMV